MSIDAKHPLYKQHETQWKRCRDAYNGEDAVKQMTKLYLPKPDGLDVESYSAYVMRASFYEAVGRTIDGFTGAISRKDPVIEVPAQLEPILEDATADGMPLNELIKVMCCETILQARSGVLVDWDDELQRPFLSFWTTEAITNWSKDWIVLHETVYEPDEKDQFTQNAIEQYRQLSLENGSYVVTLWRKKASGNVTGEEWEIYQRPTPMRRGQALDQIPFFWLTPHGSTPKLEMPPLLGLVNICMSHYRNSADMEHGLHFTGLPTPYATGIVNPDQKFHIGSTAFLTFDNQDTKVGYLEFTGQGLMPLSEAMLAKEKKMAVLGASVFQSDPRNIEAAETVRIRKSGETSLLMGVVTAVEATVKMALECASLWLGVTGETKITLNHEFIDITLDGPTLAALTLAYQSGGMSLEQYLYNLQQGELLAPDTDIPTEAAATMAANDVRAAKQSALDAKAKGPTA